MLQVNSNNRPSCFDLLNNSIINIYMELNDNNNNTNLNFNDDILLKTIYFPKNLGTLEIKLPKANYNGKHVKIVILLVFWIKIILTIIIVKKIYLK